MSLLKKGLSFAPSRGPNQFGLFKDLHNFICLLTLKRHFAKTQNISDTSNTQAGEASQAGTSTGTLDIPEASINDPDLVQILGDL